MFLVLPYRAKNPPERYPYITLGLMATNILVYACTTDLFLRIRESSLAVGGLSLAQFSFVRLITSMFLHADPMHLIGNMLFLWVFGSAVEGRLGYIKFPLVYLAAGFSAAFLHLLISGVASPDTMYLGASGAIMGMAGAYLWMFPFAAINVLFGYPTLMFMRLRLMEWQAQWVALYFLGFDLLYGLFLSRYSGVAHFAHLGGAAGGFLLVMALRERRDNEYYAEAQKVRVESGGNLLSLPLHDLETLMEGQTDNVDLITAYLKKAAAQHDGNQISQCVKALNRHWKILAEKGDHNLLGPVVLALPDTVRELPIPLLLQFGSRYAIDGRNDLAARLFRRAFDLDPNGKEAELALLRLARVSEKFEQDKGRVAAIYAEMLRRFPDGPQAVHARQALERLGAPTVVFSAGNTGALAAPPPPLPTNNGDMPSLAAVNRPASSDVPSSGSPILAPVGSKNKSDDDGDILRPIGS